METSTFMVGFAVGFAPGLVLGALIMFTVMIYMRRDPIEDDYSDLEDME